MTSDLRSIQTKAKILIVEDDLDTLATLARLLRMEGHVVHTAEGYQAALEVTKRERIDLAICGIALWDGDGCNLVKELRKLQDLKAIAITDFALAEDAERFQKTGFAAVLRKPLRLSQVTSAIAKLMPPKSVN